LSGSRFPLTPALPKGEGEPGPALELCRVASFVDRLTRILALPEGGAGVRAGPTSPARHPLCAKEAIQNSMNTLAWSFDRWLRCSLVTDPGYTPRSRLASGQNPGAPVVHVILNSLLRNLDAIEPLAMIAGVNILELQDACAVRDGLERRPVAQVAGSLDDVRRSRSAAEGDRENTA